MTMFQPSVNPVFDLDREGLSIVGIPALDRAFAFMVSNESENRLLLLDVIPGQEPVVTEIWTGDFQTIEDRDAVLVKVRGGGLDLLFLGRVTMTFGSAVMDRIVDRILRTAAAERKQAADQAAEEARQHLLVNLYAREGKHKRHVLELQRESRDRADWKVVYDRAAERDRLCDWLRWQHGRFLGFLEYAAEHGNEALTRLLTDEMFETERRIKKEGRGAGGLRPLRMWRGD